ncbi:MAG: aminotransferase class I/II-fold pyridoxal phosphate-dependent enzyme [Lactobacillales bacterium]|jgi:cystathionine gamma-synthase|nr:aminotransferase class I/II-fold pyridoxal phosphate-dependent enzyme [Lactobacillales bacterium]
MSKEQQQSIETILAQIGARTDKATGALNSPVYFSTTYQHPEFGKSTGYDYTRTKNPTRAIAEEALATLEGGAVGLVTSSGMSAIQLAVEYFPLGSEIIACRDLYGGSYRWFNQLNEKGAYKFKYADSEEDFLRLISEKTVAVFVETPTNPLMNELDIEKISEVAHNNGALVIVDNTFYTPIIQRPLELGADIVVHSATKYLGGHNDLLAGAVITKDEKIGEQLGFNLNTTGQVLSPFDSWLLIRGMKTLALRMSRHEENAAKIVAFLEKSDSVKEVLYTGRGGMISFKVTEEQTIPAFINSLKLFTFAESLGGVESLITYPTTQTHADIPAEVRESYGLTDDLLRLSVGIEAPEDLIADLEQAFLASGD